VDQATFNDLHTSCITALEDYVTSAHLTATMLAHCTPEPMPLTDRLNLMVQEVAEEDAHSIYRNLKRIIHEAARLGFHSSLSSGSDALSN